MRRTLSDRTKLVLVFVLLLVTSLVADVSKGKEIRSGQIHRSDIGEEEKEIYLELEVDGMIDDYEYLLEVSPVLPTKETSEEYFQETIDIIEKDFSEIKTLVPRKKEYMNGAVKAKWSFQPYGIIDEEGTIRVEEMNEEESIMQAQVALSCGNYEKIHSFSFRLKKPALSEEESLLEKLQSQIGEQMLLEGESEFKLPTELDGKKVTWTEKREYITPQIMMLEIVAILLLVLLSKKKRQEEEQKKLEKMKRAYPDIVSHLSLLLGAGMTSRQAWTQMAALYKWKKNSGIAEQDAVYEAILRMERRLEEGESERVVYQSFSEEITAPCYRKLMRILLGSLEKGGAGISVRLQEESRSAFDQKILIAKKRGEEASTKMLVPLMIMMMLIMAIVMLPAILEFQI